MKLREKIPYKRNELQFIPGFSRSEWLKNYSSNAKAWIYDWYLTCEYIYSDEAINDNYNFRQLLIDLLYDLESNDLDNVRNRNLFSNALKFHTDNNTAVSKNFTELLNLLRREFGAQRPRVMEKIVKNLLSDLDKEKYFLKLIDNICYLINDGSFDLDKISFFNSELIYELMHKNYSFDEISDIPSRIFSRAEVNEDGSLLTRFPQIEDSKEYAEIEESDCSEVALRINNMSDSERLSYLVTYFETEVKSFSFTFPLIGIKQSEFSIANTMFYLPSEQKDEVDHFEDDTFENTRDESFLNARVKVSASSSSEGVKKSKAEIESLFDLIKLITNSKTIIHADYDNYIIHDLGQRYAGSRRSYKRNMSWYDAISFNTEFFEEDNFILADQVSKILTLTPDKNGKTLLTALRWYRKGLESINLEDQILCYWICVEKLFASVNPAEVVVSKNKDKKSKAEIVINCISTLKTINLIFTKRLFSFVYTNELIKGQTLSFTNEEIEVLNLLPDDHVTVNLNEFLQNIDLILRKPLNPHTKSILESCRSFYFDKSFCKSYLEKKNSRILEKVTLLYRSRNAIVHDGNHDSFDLILQAQYGKETARTLIYEFSRFYQINPNFLISDFIYSIQMSYELLEESLSKDNLFNCMKRKTIRRFV